VGGCGLDFAQDMQARGARACGHPLVSVALSFLSLAEAAVEPVDTSVASAALAAFDRYGRGSGHAADLNMGDCFAYAFAQTLNEELLYKDKDFALTDVHRFGAAR
jgi:uncharacterized protein with PIN domain